MNDARRKVVSLALEWLGTPYRHDARIKGVAADCTFFAKVYEEAGIIPPVEIAPYSPQAHFHRASSIYLDTIMRFATEITDPLPGDIVMYKIGRSFSHGGVVVLWPDIVHGSAEDGAVILARGDQGKHVYQAKETKFFTFMKEEAGQ